jgi:pimeloyl-ACP methyl ester carboxylesterase
MVQQINQSQAEYILPLDINGLQGRMLPGFGGMDPLYNIGEKATLDNLADYLASFIKVRYKNRRFTIMAVSYGFTVVTRMLQKYPEIAKKVDLLVSWVGFVHKDDFRWKKSTVFWLKYGSRCMPQQLLLQKKKLKLLCPPNFARH